MILIPWIGTGPSQAVLIAILAGSGLLMLVPLLRPFRLDQRAGHRAPRR